MHSRTWRRFLAVSAFALEPDLRKGQGFCMIERDDKSSAVGKTRASIICDQYIGLSNSIHETHLVPQ